MLSAVFRTFNRRVHVHLPSKPAADTLGFIDCRPEIDGPSPAPLDLQVEPYHGFLRLTTPDGVRSQGSAVAILDDLYRMRFAMVRQERPLAAFITGATVTSHQGHILFIGAAGVGKSTLLLHLADRGWRATGDQQLIVEGANATPFPNTLRVGPGALPYLSPRAVALVRASTSLAGWFDQQTYSVDPSGFGQPWRIGPAPLAHVVVMQANHGGGSRLRPLSRTVAMSMLMQNVRPPPAGRARALADVHALMSSARTWELRTGRLDDAERHLQALLHIP